jgi:hypothetical protein
VVDAPRGHAARHAYHRDVSISVALERLRDEIDTRDLAYLLTVSDDDRPHGVAVVYGWDGDELVVGAGNRSHANAEARPRVSLMWPPTEPGGYTLIVDATVTTTSGTGAGDNALRLRPTSAVLHRPATGDAPTRAGCEADCEPVLRSG